MLATHSPHNTTTRQPRMQKSPLSRPDPRLDLVLERVVDVPAALVWEAWTVAEHLKAWFTPKPWRTVECEIDLRPGGVFRTRMESPTGERFDNVGCYLEIVPPERLIWTPVLLPGWRPAHSARFNFTAVVEIEALGERTRYVATAMHADETGRARHEKMGFHAGWGTALDQLVDHMRATLRLNVERG
jgi:uncharacterized protein YndB with AHSA1/START domain